MNASSTARERREPTLDDMIPLTWLEAGHFGTLMYGRPFAFLD